jgi:hypothetical protein
VSSIELKLTRKQEQLKILKRLTQNNQLILDTGVLKYLFELILKPESQLSSENKEELVIMINLFQLKNLITVPQVFSELYSLLKRDSKNEDELKGRLINLLPYFKDLEEMYINKKIILNERERFLEFGFTDIALKNAVLRKKGNNYYRF